MLHSPKTERKKIYEGNFTIDDNAKICKPSGSDYSLAIIKDNFENNTKDCGYINIVNTFIYDTDKIVLDGKKLKINNSKSENYKNNKTDKPIIFKITLDDKSEEMYFCSNIEFIRECNTKYSKTNKGEKQISLFKNDKIKKVEIIEYFFSNGDKGYECDYLFHNCSNLEEINLDTNDKEICLCGKNMFSGCENLKKITMTKIHNKNPNDNEFTNCTNLKELILNKDFNLGISGFGNCKNLKTIKFVDDDGIPFKGSISCGNLCFSNCEILEKIEVESIITNLCTKKFYNNCKKLKIPKTIIYLGGERDIGFFNFDDMFFGVSKKYNDEITIQFNRNNKEDLLPDFNYDKVFNGCDVEKINIIVKELDEIENGKVKKKGEEKILKNITKDDKVKWFLCFPDNYIKLRDLYQNTSDPTLITCLNSKFKSNKSKEEIEKEYNEFKKEYEENNKITDQKKEKVNVDKDLGTCGLCFSKCCCCCKKNR